MVDPLVERKRRIPKVEDYNRQRKLKNPSDIVNVSNLEISDWVQLYQTQRTISVPISPMARSFEKYLYLPSELRITNSRAADNQGLKYRDICTILNRHSSWDKGKF